MSVAVAFLCILLIRTLSGFILPMSQPDGTADISSVINHVALLEQTVSGLQKTTGQLKTDLQTSSVLQQAASKEISSLKDEVASLKVLFCQGNDPAPIAFNVYDAASQVPGKPLTFADHHYNAGSYFNTSRRSFTAPVSGTYMFWTKLELSKSNSTTYVYIMKNGGLIAMDTDIKDNFVSVMVVDHVDKGSDVWVKIVNSHGIPTAFPSSSFGGTLLFAD